MATATIPLRIPTPALSDEERAAITRSGSRLMRALLDETDRIHTELRESQARQRELADRLEQLGGGHG